MMRLVFPAAPLALLAACSGTADETTVDAVSPSESEALDKAAAMIEQRRLPEDALPADSASQAETRPQGAMPDGAAPQESGGPEPMELPSE